MSQSKQRGAKHRPTYTRNDFLCTEQGGLKIKLIQDELAP